MNFYKKLILAFFCFFSSIYISYGLSINDLIELIMDSNTEIQAALTTYETQILATKSLNGAYIPGISFNALSKVPKNYEWNNAPDYFDTNMIINQSLPGGTSFSIESDYNYSTTTFNSQRFITQSPNISFSLSQSLLPFWLQGQIKDPLFLSFKQQEEYSYYQFLYTKKNVLIQLLQNYVFALISKNEISMNQNSIGFYDEQIDSLKELKENGNTSLSKILEIENSRWQALQNLMSAQANYEGYIQTLKNLCSKDFDENLLEFSADQYAFENLLKFLDNIIDPLEKTYLLKMELLKSNRILEKQSSAPMLNLSIKPSWDLETTIQNEWKTAWKKSAPSNWTLGLGINLSPMLTGFAKQNNKKFKLEYSAAQKSYESYIHQKEFVKKQYSSLFANYSKQKETINNLYISGLQELKDYEYQFKTDAVSKLDYDSIRVRVENCGLSKACIELYAWLYDLMAKLQ